MAIFRPHGIDYRDVSYEFAVCMLIFGGILLLVSRRPLPGERGVKLLLLFISLASIIMLDRGLLVYLGRSPWVTDPAMHYRHRPSTTHSFKYWYRDHRGTTTHTPTGIVHINRYGQHDDDFELTPPPGQWRGLIIGDSVTMGHGVEKDFAYANQLEDLLGAFDNRNSSHQIINAGVQGYNTEQEYHMLSETLYLQPDFAIVGFCYNDLRLDESLQTYKHDEVRGYDPWLRYLLTETGFGLSIQKFRQYRFRSRAATISEDTGRLRRSILRDPVQRSLVTNRLNDDMSKIYAISRENDVDAILLILPAMEQLFRPELQAFHADLTDFAKRNNVLSVDLTAVFEQSIAARVNRILSERPSVIADAATVDALRNFEARKFYIDDIHLTQRGHRLVAETIALFLNKSYDLRFATASFTRAVIEETARMDSTSSSFILPSDYQAALQTGLALQALGNANMAVDVYERALYTSQHAGERSRLHYMIGKVRTALGQRQVGITHLRHAAINLQTSSWPAADPQDYNQFGLDLLLMDLPNEAIIAFAKNLTTNPDNKNAYVGLGRAFYQIGSFESAIDAYSHARQGGSTCIIEFNLGLVYLRKGDIAEAKQVYAQAMNFCGDRSDPIDRSIADLQKLRAAGLHIEATTDIITILNGK